MGGRLIRNEQDSLWTETIESQSHVLRGTCVQVLRKTTKNLSRFWYPTVIQSGILSE